LLSLAANKSSSLDPKTPFTMPEPNNNIFLTTENLAFSMPLILVCSLYAFFKYIPLQYGLPALVILVVVYQLKARVKAHSDAKLEVLDEDFVKELVGDEGNADASKKEEIAKKQRKQLAKLEIRLAQEKKAAAKQAGMTKKEKKAQKAQEESEIDEDEAMLMFAKGSRVISTGKKTK